MAPGSGNIASVVATAPHEMQNPADFFVLTVTGRVWNDCFIIDSNYSDYKYHTFRKNDVI